MSSNCAIFRNRGLIEPGREGDPAAILALIYQTLMTGIGSLVLALGIMGIIPRTVAARGAPRDTFAVDSGRHRDV